MDQDLKSLLYKSLLGIVLLFAAIFFLSLFVKEPVVKYSSLFVEYFGIWGVGMGIALSDALPGFLIPDAFLVFAVAGKLPDLPVIVICSVGSLIGGSFSYFVGSYLVPKFKWGQDFLYKHEKKLIPFLEKYGSKAIILAAVTPLPYSWMCILVGTLKMPFSKFLTASLARIPRFAVYFYLIKLGWVHGV